MTVRTTMDTPDGPFTVLATDQGVLASGWTHDVPSLVALVHPALGPTVESITALPPTERGADDPSVAVLSDAVRAVVRYYAGDVSAPAAVPVRQRAADFREHAWAVLRTIPPGERLSYREYARRAARPAAVRAAAGACAMNAAALFVPCHRVVRSDGSLGGFRYGLTIKESLLARELRS